MPTCLINPAHRVRLVETVSRDWLISAARRDLGLDAAAEFSSHRSLQRYRCLDCQLEYFAPPVTGGAAFYQALLRQDWYQPASKFEHHLAAKFIQAGQSVLDVGCGDRRFSRFVPDSHYTGIDEHGEGTWLRLAPSSFDCVCAFQVLEHVADPMDFIRRGLRCLKPGGLLILGVPNMESYISGLVNFALNAPPHHVTAWRKATFEEVAAHFGLQILHCVESPLEDWEAALYWMGRHYARWVPREERFSGMKRWSWLIPMAYLSGKLRAFLSRPPSGIAGSTLVWVARKP